MTVHISIYAFYSNYNNIKGEDDWKNLIENIKIFNYFLNAILIILKEKKGKKKGKMY